MKTNDLRLPLKKDRLVIGSIIFPRMDQMDFSGPFSVLSRIPNAAIHTLWKDRTPFRDMHGMILTPEMLLSEAPPLDVLHIPGGFGQEALMDDPVILSFIQAQAKPAKFVLSVCTGALICGAAGLLRGRRATTHWASFDLLEHFGAIPTKARTVLDGNLMTTAGVTAGIDGALRLASLLYGDKVAQEIQLNLEYAPEPLFNSGTPETAPPGVLRAVNLAYRDIRRARRATAIRHRGQS